MIQIRRDHAALSLGNIEFLDINNERQSLVYGRHFKDETIWVAVNNNPDPVTLYLPVDVLQIDPTLKLIDLVDQSRIKIKDDDVRIPLPGYGIAILSVDGE